ncbi:phosphodiester glycosidase family protein [Desulfotomaculum copahuensis]|uniref:Copper amine oxidase n=1 Tax=Desulfotomaculum copahuensis TaxID=1838280 RepID=A0A1B7LBH6_9FIRM|nr:phosphodiester glycosidase family protein [Desulfotomaculum copahuensis]OAT79824.1 hypothetical protein A6M21_15410 [Desulfotomaculum copahuensis]
MNRKKFFALLLGGALFFSNAFSAAAAGDSRPAPAGGPASVALPTGQPAPAVAQPAPVATPTAQPAPQQLVSPPAPGDIRTVAPGVRYYPISGHTWQGEPLHGYVVEVDPGQSLLEVRVTVPGHTLGDGETLSGMAASHGAVAAINGGFFDGSGGHPIGSLVQDGRILATSAILRTSIGILNHNRLQLGYFSPRVTVRFGGGGAVPVQGVNTSAAEDGVTLYTPAWGQSIDAPANGVNVVVERRGGADVVQSVSAGSVSMPADGYVLTLQGSAAAGAGEPAAGTAVKLGFDYGAGWDGLKHLVTAGPLLVADGQPVLQGIMEGFRGSLLEPSPRTAIGVNREGRLLLVVVDGREPGWSAGVTMEELAYLMTNLGAVRAAALDGGASSAMWVSGRIVNRPSDGRERALADAILVLRQVPVYLDGTRIFFDVPPVVENGRTLVPLRGIFEKLGASVDWNAATQTVTASRGGREASLTIGKRQARVNGETVNLDVPAQLVNGRTMVPLRFVGEALGAGVAWQDAPPAVLLTSPSAAGGKAGR